MNEEAQTAPSCQVCGRGLLPGERPTEYVTRDGAHASVCELCRPRAEAAGWLRPHEAETAGGGGRERRRPRGQMFGGLRARLPTASNGESRAGLGSADPEGAEAGSARRGAGSRADAPAPAMVAGNSPGISVPEALRAFNASNHRRTVAGLTRTLGPARASGLAIRAANGYPGARLTVAWELTWYQWEVGAGPRGPEVRESGKGETIGQLRAADRTWNLLVGSDGTLERRVAAASAEEGGG